MMIHLGDLAVNTEDVVAIEAQPRTDQDSYHVRRFRLYLRSGGFVSSEILVATQNTDDNGLTDFMELLMIDWS